MYDDSRRSYASPKSDGTVFVIINRQIGIYKAVAAEGGCYTMTEFSRCKSHYAPTIILLVSLLIVMAAAEGAAWPWSKKKEIVPFREYPSGWKIIKIIPADETDRVNGFEAMFSKCSACMKLAYKDGNFLLYREMRRVNYEGWWTFIVYIPEDHFLNIPQSATVTMKVVGEDDSTRYVQSKRIVFCKGWLRGALKKAIQHTIYDNSTGSIQVKPYRDIGRDDFEFTTFGIKGGTRYTVGYIYFGETREIKEVVDFLTEGIDAYPLSNTKRR